MHGELWSSLTLTTALLYPGIAFVAFFGLNFFIWAQGGRHATLLLGWLFACLPAMAVVAGSRAQRSGAAGWLAGWLWY